MCQRFDEYYQCVACKAIYGRTMPVPVYACPAASAAAGAARRPACRKPQTIPALVHWELCCDACAAGQRARETVARSQTKHKPLFWDVYDNEWSSTW